MISRHQHKGGEHQAADLRALGKLPLHAVQRGIAFHCSKIDPVTMGLQHMLHLGICGIGKMGGSVAHEHQRLVRVQGWQPVQQSLGNGKIVLLAVQQRHTHRNLHPHPIRLQLGQHFFVFLAVHHMGGLNRHMGIAFLLQAVHGLMHIFNLYTVPLFQLSDNHSAGKGAANLPIREGLRQSLLRSSNGFAQGVGVRGAKGYCQNRFFHCFLSCARIRVF